MKNEITEGKKQLRDKIWNLLEQEKVAVFPLPVFGRIPNFVGSDKAANLVRTLPEWKKAKVVFANPDSAQKKIREFALKEGKILIMASPRLKHGFLQIDPQNTKGKEEVASSIKGAFKYGKPVEDHAEGGIEKLKIPPFDRLTSCRAHSVRGRVVSEVEPPQAGMPKPDLIITGCVAVDLSGWRLGKGGGYGDIEVKRIKDEFGEIPVLTTIHPLQMVDFVPHLNHDAKVDIIVTPGKIYRIEKS
ncbi:MAG: 5-formyltetrahydrofolate cyclo-ligase [candidate division Zixibacteria bacterium]|nr:5-formyltetrahydrofolate cyclo-ligase [candidate division Zixibacteria bacterium]